MFERRSGLYTSARMHHWLSWLARAMNARQQSEFHLDRLEPDWLPGPLSQRVAAVSPALVVGLISGLLIGLLLGLLEGVVIGLFFTLVFGWRKADPHEDVGWSWPRIRDGLRVGLAVGLIFMLDGLSSGLVGGLAEGLFFGLIGGLLYGLRTTEPVEEVSWSWWRARIGLAVGLAGGLVCGSVYGLTSPTLELAQGLFFGLFFGLAVGLIYGLVPGLIHKRTNPTKEFTGRRAVLWRSVYFSVYSLRCLFGCSSISRRRSCSSYSLVWLVDWFSVG